MRSEKIKQTSAGWKHILLLGCDSQIVEEYERSDAILVLSINRDGAVRLTSIMRDIWVNLPGFGEGKINAAVWYGGPELAMRVVSEYFGFQIDKYAMVNMKGMVNIIDLLGGIDVEITEEERVFINHCAVDVQRIIRDERVIQPLEHTGLVHLCGAQAVGHMRNRTNGADYMRTARQRQVLKAIAKKIRTKKNLPQLFRLAIEGIKLPRTNLNLMDLAQIFLLALRQNPGAINCFRIPAEGTYTVVNDGIWHFETDFEKNRQLLTRFFENRPLIGTNRNVCLSVCMIVKNEEAVLDRCLSAVSRFADELIIVDTGSEDETKEIAGRYTPLVYDYQWHDSFCDARNYSFEQASGDYLMWLDADDVIDDENIDRILQLKADAFQNADVIFTTYRNDPQSRLITYKLRDRIFRRELRPTWKYDIHEMVQIDDSWKTIYREDITVLHKKEHILDKGRNMRIFERRIRENRALDAWEISHLCSEYVVNGRFEEACDLYRRSRHELSGARLSDALHAVESAFLTLELYEELYTLIEEAEQKLPPISKEKFVKGVCREFLGDLEGAAELFREAASIPDDPRTGAIIETGYNDYFPLLHLAFVAYKMGNREEALRGLNAASELYPHVLMLQVVKEKMLTETPPEDPSHKARISH